MDSLLRDEQVELAVTCAVFIVGLRQSLNPLQQSDFFTPWVKAPESEEEQFHQDLVWIHKVLPPNDKFNPDLAAKGYYKKLKQKQLNKFWSTYNPEKKEQRSYIRHIPINKKKLSSPIKTSLRSIRKKLAEGDQSA